jgi:hypothetical protein
MCAQRGKKLAPMLTTDIEYVLHDDLMNLAGSSMLASDQRIVSQRCSSHKLRQQLSHQLNGLHMHHTCT